MTQPRPLLNPEQVAQTLGFSVAHVYRMVSEKQLPYLRIGRQLRFEPDAIDAWLESRKIPAVKK